MNCEMRQPFMKCTSRPYDRLPRSLHSPWYEAFNPSPDHGSDRTDGRPTYLTLVLKRGQDRTLSIFQQLSQPFEARRRARLQFGQAQMGRFRLLFLLARPLGALLCCGYRSKRSFRLR